MKRIPNRLEDGISVTTDIITTRGDDVRGIYCNVIIIVSIFYRFCGVVIYNW